MRVPVLVAIFIIAISFAAQADPVRAAVGDPLRQAEELIQRQEYRSALMKVAQASAVGHLTSYETLVVAQVRGIAAAGAGDYTLAAEAYETVLNSGSLPASAQMQYLQAISGFYYEAKDYPLSVTWINRYVSAGGNDPRTVALLAQSYYEEGDFRHAELAVWKEQKIAQAQGEALPQAELQLLASSAEKSNDSQAYSEALELLLNVYPSKQYWETAIGLLVAKPNFPDRLILDVYRLRLATGTLIAPADYEDFAERAILAGDPQEAKAAIDAGFASGVLTSTTDEGRAQRLRVLVTRDASVPSQPTSDYVQQAKKQAGGPDGNLNLGIAYYKMGNMPLALRSFQSQSEAPNVSNTDPTIMLTRLWTIKVEGVMGKK
jgi:hypothetical protein